MEKLSLVVWEIHLCICLKSNMVRQADHRTGVGHKGLSTQPWQLLTRWSQDSYWGFCLSTSSLATKQVLCLPHRSEGLSIITCEMPGVWKAVRKYTFSGLLESNYMLSVSTSRPHHLGPRLLGWALGDVFANSFLSLFSIEQRYENRDVESDVME